MYSAPSGRAKSATYSAGSSAGAPAYGSGFWCLMSVHSSTLTMRSVHPASPVGAYIPSLAASIFALLDCFDRLGDTLPCRLIRQPEVFRALVGLLLHELSSLIAQLRHSSSRAQRTDDPELAPLHAAVHIPNLAILATFLYHAASSACQEPSTAREVVHRELIPVSSRQRNNSSLALPRSRCPGTSSSDPAVHNLATTATALTHYRPMPSITPSVGSTAADTRTDHGAFFSSLLFTHIGHQVDYSIEVVSAIFTDVWSTEPAVKVAPRQWEYSDLIQQEFFLTSTMMLSISCDHNGGRALLTRRDEASNRPLPEKLKDWDQAERCYPRFNNLQDRGREPKLGSRKIKVAMSTNFSDHG
ncbi:hypothetical protein EJ08DRAFT_722869 [Tothia fuscella]|uniref:Uncharacterized protein n=1 Tax=Tothia fuscella TaxID=1048955 RepID=A0A9P4NKR1_9PEZI|nr:hypothetical protein EJ08DRAFT_722869 [Tothia fuscella]